MKLLSLTQQTAVVLLTLGSLTACGGGGGGDNTVVPEIPEATPTPEVTPEPEISPAPDDVQIDLPIAKQSVIHGKAIDGYIQGATVYLDINFNGELDSEEPYSQTGSGGGFTLEFDDSNNCAENSPIVVDVPVGAVDEDLGMVTMAYQMVTPPKVSLSDIEDLDTERYITPLTTAIWKDLARSLPENASCIVLTQNQSMLDEIKEATNEALGNIASRYGADKKDLLSDFIAGGNTELHEKAMHAVKVLKASFVAKRKIKELYSDAQSAGSDVFEQEINGNTYWVEQIRVFFNDFHDLEVRTVLTNDLQSDYVFVKDESKYTVTSDGIIQGVGYMYRNFPSSDASCILRELTYYADADKEFIDIDNRYSHEITQNSNCSLEQTPVLERLLVQNVTKGVYGYNKYDHLESARWSWFANDNPISALINIHTPSYDAQYLKGETVTMDYSFDMLSLYGDSSLVFAKKKSKNIEERKVIDANGHYFSRLVNNDDGSRELYCGTNEDDLVLDTSGKNECANLRQ
ncbi:MAG: hypothetical protein GY787_22495 [Alteromonadales bacterium]|nr:hypothetical protein [Alteromonadales bacterium]